MKTNVKRLFEISYLTGKNGVKYRLDSESVRVRYHRYKMHKKHLALQVG